MHRMQVKEHMERIRRSELQSVKRWFKPGAKVLEIGGGNGFQAAEIASWNCEVESFELPGKEAEYFPVKEYDGHRFPVSDRYFDVVFSSNVLEHINPIAPTLAEIRRILKPEGIAIHVLPSSAWRFWSIVSYYPYFLARLIRKSSKAVHNRKDAFILPTPNMGEPKSSILEQMIKSAVPRPHGEFPSAISELHYYRRIRWQLAFKEAGFDTLEVYENDIFYTDHVLFPFMGLAARQFLARLFGSSCNVFVLKKCL